MCRLLWLALAMRAASAAHLCASNVMQDDSVNLLQTTSEVSAPRRGDLGADVRVKRGRHSIARRQGLAAWRAAALEVTGEDLFPAGQIPDPMPVSVGSEAFVPPDPNDLVGMICCPGDTSGMWYYNVSVPQLYAFPADPSDPNFKDAAVLVFPGGGHQHLSWNKDGTDIAQWLNTLGYSAFVLKYRVPETNTIKRSVQDAQRALSLVRSKAAQLGINASRVGIMGFSGGGKLCADVALQTERTYDSIDEVDTFNFRPDFSMPIYGLGDPSLPLGSTAPTFLASAANDQCASAVGVLAYYTALLSSGVPAELHIYGDGHHGYGRCSMWTHTGEWDAVCRWPEDAAYYLEHSVMGIKPELPAPFD